MILGSTTEEVIKRARGPILLAAKELACSLHLGRADAIGVKPGSLPVPLAAPATAPDPSGAQPERHL
jgi:hypothetical protein